MPPNSTANGTSYVSSNESRSSRNRHILRLRYLREFRGWVIALAGLIGAATPLVVALVRK